MAQKQVVDLPLGVLNQTPADTEGPLGRLVAAVDCQVSKYERSTVVGGTSVPQKLRYDPRDGFLSYANTLRSVVDGTVKSGSFVNPELLAALDNQLVSICDSVPRVWNTSTWSYYPDTRVIPYRLEQDVFHTSNKVIVAPDSTVMNGTRCEVWTEQTTDATGVYNRVFIGFKSANGAWLVSPTQIQNAGYFNSLCKVVNDGTYFYIVYPSTDGANLVVNAYDQNGAYVSNANVSRPDGSVPGFFDVTVTN